jgi:hypothetical protein
MSYHRVYKLHSSDAFEGLILEGGPEAPWKGDGLYGACEVRVRPVGTDRPWGDFPALEASVPVFSERAKAGLEDLMGLLGEWIPVVGAGRPLMAFNVSPAMNVLDEEATAVRRSVTHPTSRHRIYRFVDRFDEKEGPAIFKVPQEPTVFVKHVFRMRVAWRGLVGFEFEEVFG